jgi:hypothetical protein
VKKTTREADMRAALRNGDRIVTEGPHTLTDNRPWRRRRFDDVR